MDIKIKSAADDTVYASKRDKYRNAKKGSEDQIAYKDLRFTWKFLGMNGTEARVEIFFENRIRISTSKDGRDMI